EIVLITERAQARWIEQKIFASSSWAKSQPARRQHPNKMSAGKKQHVTRNCADALHYTVRAFADLFRRLPSGSTIAKQLPIGVLAENFRRGQPFVLTVGPLHKVRIGFGPASKPRQ